MRDQQNMHAPDFAADDQPSQGGSEPVDVVQVRADEALVAALGASLPPSIDDPIDDRLANLLWSWRDDVEPVPKERLVDADTAAAVLAAAPRPHRRYTPFGPFAAAAAVFVLAFVGLGLAAEDARPGDTLWNVTKVLYAEKAKSVEAAATVRSKLDEASKALDSGNTAWARTALQEAQTRLPAIAPEDGQGDLAKRTQALLAAVESVTPPPSQAAPTTKAPQSQAAPAPPPAAAGTPEQPPPQTDAPAATTPPQVVPPATTTTENTPPPPVTSTTPTDAPPPPTTPDGGQTTGATAPGSVTGQAATLGDTTTAPS